MMDRAHLADVIRDGLEFDKPIRDGARLTTRELLTPHEAGLVDTAQLMWDHLRDLPDEDRWAIVKSFPICFHCGSKDTRCQCDNDS